MGKKVKRFAKFIIIFGILCWLALIVFGIKMWGEYSFNTAVLGAQSVSGHGNTQETIAKVTQTSYWIYFIVGGCIGIVSTLFSGLPLYWFGCMFERIERIERAVALMEDDMYALKGEPHA